MVINHLLSGMVLQESALPAMPAQKGKSCLEGRQMQGQPLQPCIAWNLAVRITRRLRR